MVNVTETLMGVGAGNFFYVSFKTKFCELPSAWKKNNLCSVLKMHD